MFTPPYDRLRRHRHCRRLRHPLVNSSLTVLVADSRPVSAGLDHMFASFVARLREHHHHAPTELRFERTGARPIGRGYVRERRSARRSPGRGRPVRLRQPRGPRPGLAWPETRRVLVSANANRLRGSANPIEPPEPGCPNTASEGTHGRPFAAQHVAERLVHQA